MKRCDTGAGGCVNVDVLLGHEDQSNDEMAALKSDVKRRRAFFCLYIRFSA